MNVYKKNIIILLIIFLMSFIALPTQADSGWDYDYDSGSSYSSSDWDSDSSYSSSDRDDYNYSNSDRNNSSSSSLSFDKKLLVAIISGILFISYIGLISYISKKMKRMNLNKDYEFSNEENSNKTIGITDEHIDKIVPGLTERQIVEECFDKYKKVQIAWSNIDLDELKTLLTDELYNMYSSQLKTLKLKEQRNIMEDMNLISSNLMDIYVEGESLVVTVNITVSQKDYVVDKNNKIVQGTKSKLNIVCYQIDMIKPVGDKNVDKCPHCGANISNMKNGKCEYCNSTLINNNNEFVISKKKIIRQD